MTSKSRAISEPMMRSFRAASPPQSTTRARPGTRARRTPMPEPGPVRAPMRLVTDGNGGASGATVSTLLAHMRQSAFQGRKLGEAFEVWQQMVDGRFFISLGLAGSIASAGLGPLITWLIERGYV